MSNFILQSTIFPPFVKVGTGFCPQTAFGREPVDRRLAKCDAGSFVGTSSISFASAQSAKAHPFRCASSQNRNRFAGLRFCSLHVGATWAFSAAPHTHSLSGQKAAHSGDTRLTARCRRSAHPQGRSCRSFSRAENRHHRPFSGRSGVLRCSFETRLKCRFALEYQRFFGFDARSCSASSPRFRQGRSFPTTLLQGR